jgi:N-acetyl-gamma-glutamyl-phosphate reductase
LSSRTTPGGLRTAVIGVTGYAGAELARLLLLHPHLVQTPPIFLNRDIPQLDATTLSLTGVQPQLSGLPNADDLAISLFASTPDFAQLAREGVSILFLATPHEQSRAWVPGALAHNIRVIDLSGAWRLHNPANAAVYNLTDADPAAADALQHEAVYGSPELHAAAIASARLVANPGCYATSIILGLAPLLRSNMVDISAGIIADAKSGVSGAGKTPTPSTHFMHAADNLSAYAVFGHRHTGELLEQLHLTSADIQFTPHLLPIPRGILSTLYVRLNQPADTATVQSILDTFYADSPMVRVRTSPMLPQIQHVVRTSFCDIGFQVSPDGKRLIIISCLDNLLKGAASQAVQNMNIMAGFRESDGLLQ